jgi:hypothetical protein
MAKYESRYASLGFYVGGDRKRFAGGKYITENAAEIKVLDGTLDVTRVDEPEVPKKAEPTTDKSDTKPQGKAQSNAKK